MYLREAQGYWRLVLKEWTTEVKESEILRSCWVGWRAEEKERRKDVHDGRGTGVKYTFDLGLAADFCLHQTSSLDRQLGV